jgi:hypothetical protein
MPNSSASPIPLRSRRTFYDGIEMRSRLEAKVAAALDHKGLAWEHEGPCYATESGQYLPDFRVLLDENTLVYLEVKGFIRTEEAVREVQEKMEVIWKTDRDAVLMLWEGWPVTRQWAATFNLGWYEAGE